MRGSSSKGGNERSERRISESKREQQRREEKANNEPENERGVRGKRREKRKPLMNVDPGAQRQQARKGGRLESRGNIDLTVSGEAKGWLLWCACLWLSRQGTLKFSDVLF